jgi:hypothetical protein
MMGTWIAGAVASVAVAGAGEWRIDWHSIDGGGRMMTQGSGLSLSGTVGQSDAGGVMTGQGLELTGGFWGATAVEIGSLPGDCDGDGDIDLADYGCFANCVGGPDVTVDGDCGTFDFDGDQDVDFADWGGFQVAFTG